MDAAESQSVIVSKLREALDGGIPSRLLHCRPDPYAPPGGSVLPVSRLDMILSGRRRVELNLADGPSELLLKAGDAYMAPPGAWERHSWDTVGEMLCIVPQKRFLRVSYYDQRDKAKRPDAIYHHTMRLCPPSLLSVVSLLERPEICEGVPEAGLSLSRALIALALEECSLPSAPSVGRGAVLFERIRDWLDDHFQDDVSIDSVAERFGVGSDYVSKLFRRHSGEGLHVYLTSVRMELARYLLASTEMDLKRIAAQCGFKGQVHFTRRFRELNGIPPLRYRLSGK